MAEDRARTAQLVSLRSETSKTLALESIHPPFHRPIRERDPATLDSRLVLLLEPDSQRAESFRSTCDTLIENSLPRIVAVSSSAPNEGKTMTAINLALALAEQPSTLVLLLDANFFAPSLHAIFLPDVDPRDLLLENTPASLAPYRIADVMPNLHVGVIAPEPGKPTPSFNRRRFDMALGRLSSVAYDHIIIDAPALDGSASATQIINAAEGTVLTARSAATTARHLRRATELIPKNRALGVVLVDDS